MKSSGWKTVCACAAVMTGAAMMSPTAEAGLSSPGQVANLRLWLDAGDTGTISSSGGFVSAWSDKSGNAINVAQGTAGRQPLTGVNTLNGHNVLSFDGVDDYLFKDGGALPLAGGDDTFTYFIVWKPEAAKLASVYEQSAFPQAVGTRAALLQRVQGFYGYNGEANDADFLSPYAANDWRVSGVTSTGTGLPGNIIVDDNADVYTGTINNGTQNVGATGIRVGNKLTTSTESFDGDIAEILVYDRNLSKAERSNVSGYLNEKYNVYAVADSSGALLHQWTFNDGTANDSVGTAHGTLFNGASISDGRLALDGVDDYLRTAPIDQAIGEKTLVVWAQLGNLSQRSGGLLTLEDPTGFDVFDSVVYGERTANQWMNGSNSWQRSGAADNGGALESSLSDVMIAITYYDDHSIAIYRDGELYATYVDPTLANYPAGIADVLMGLRHLDTAGNPGTALGNDPFFAGWIDEARIYGAALSTQQVQALYAAGPVVPAPAALPAGLAAMALIALRRPRRR